MRLCTGPVWMSADFFVFPVFRQPRNASHPFPRIPEPQRAGQIVESCCAVTRRTGLPVVIAANVSARSFAQPQRRAVSRARTLPCFQIRITRPYRLRVPAAYCRLPRATSSPAPGGSRRVIGIDANEHSPTTTNAGQKSDHTID